MPIIGTPISNVPVLDSYSIFATATKVFIADLANDVVRVYDTAGTLLDTFGGEGSGPGQFISPVGIAGNTSVVAVLDNKREDIQLFGA